MACAFAVAACGSSVVLWEPPEDEGVGGGGTSGGGQTVPPDCNDLKPLFELPPLRAVDIIFVVDNSGSMGEEIEAIEQNINVNFAQIIAASGVDYRLVMVTDHGAEPTDLCIGYPLSNTNNCSGEPGERAGLFYHYDINVQSTDSLCILLDTLHGIDGGGENDEPYLHPQGWAKWLRPEALKIFLEITDDGASCTWRGHDIKGSATAGHLSPDGPSAEAARSFDTLLLDEAPSQFGTEDARNYRFFSITGIREKANPLEPYEPGEPIIGAVKSEACSSAVQPGWTYQWLSKETGGLRFPVCQFSSYDAVFQAIATNVIDEVNPACSYEVVTPPGVDLRSLDVTYHPGDPMATSELLTEVLSAEACGTQEGAYFLEGTTLVLCPSTCERFRDDPGHTLGVNDACR